MVEVKSSIGFKDRPAILLSNGKVLQARNIVNMIHEVLIYIFNTKRFLFPLDINNVDLITKYYQCFQTFRHSSDTRAIEGKVSSADIDVVNRWKMVERAKGRVPGMSMQQHYAQFDQLLGPFLRYTQAM